MQISSTALPQDCIVLVHLPVLQKEDATLMLFGNLVELLY